MPTTDMLMSGVSLMLVGMGIVFLFLLVLVFAMKAMSRLAILLSERQGDAEGVSYQPAIPGETAIGARGDLIAVIAAALTHYRTTHR